MHASSLENMQKCYERYVCRHDWSGRDTIQVVDIGGANVNGSYADIFSETPFAYRAADINPGSTVDVVIEDPYKLPFDDNSVDILISGQAFEHVEFFWRLFEEMVRAVKGDGLILLIAPSSGPIHRYPVDCYRFYPDAYHALAKYAGCHLVDLWHDDRGPWKDLVGVFSKQPLERYQHAGTGQRRHDWKLNKYEKLTCPNIDGGRTMDSSAESISGDVHYLDVLGRLHETLRPRLYMEIGVRKGQSLRLCMGKALAIDPIPDLQDDLAASQQIYEMTSDEFFEFEAPNALQSSELDFVFIDGMHLFEFVLRDFINVEAYSNANTVVVIDDVLPNHVLQASRTRKTQVWTGDIWKLADCLRTHRNDLKLTVLNASPTGLLVITGLDAKNRVLREMYNPIVRNYREMLLEGEKAKTILSRSESLHPHDAAFWAGFGGVASMGDGVDSSFTEQQ